MQSVRELIGALTQARVQMMAAQAIINNEMAQDAVEGGETNALKEAQLNAQKLARCINIAGDVREWANGVINPPHDPQPDGDEEAEKLP